MDYKLEGAKIQKIYRNSNNRDGQPFMSKKGKPFSKVDIYVDPNSVSDPSFNGKFSHFEYGNRTDDWDIGTEISGVIKKNEVNGKTYFNLQLSNAGEASQEQSSELVERIVVLEKKIKEMEGVVFPERRTELEFPKKTGGGTPEAPPVEEEEVDDGMPF